MRILFVTIAVCLLLSTSALADNPWEQTSEKLAAADCVRFEFITIVTSEVFETVDTLPGTALIAADGRYLVELGSDVFLDDGKHLYSYSEENEQVVIEPSAVGQGANEVTFVTQLEKYYKVAPYWKPLNEYSLRLRDSVEIDLPKHMNMSVDVGRNELDWLHFKDENDDRTKIDFLSQDCLDECDSTAFLPDFPETAEKVKLP